MRAFTLVETLVALAIFMLLLIIIMVPMNMGMNMLHLGKAQADVQGATQAAIRQMQTDLTHAIYVYPNKGISSVTGIPRQPKLPYGKPPVGQTIYDEADAVPVAPYFVGDPCDAVHDENLRVGNTARIDMLLPLTNDNVILTPVMPGYYIVTYYARRRDVTKDYSPIDNPITLFRAQIPFRGNAVNPAYLINDTGAPVAPTPGIIYPAGTRLNANIYNSRYSDLGYGTSDACSADANRSAAWLEQSDEGEPDLEPLTNQDFAPDPAGPFVLYGSHTAILPVEIGLSTGVDYRGYDADNHLIKTYTAPKSTFFCADTNKDGIIDQVSITLQAQTIGSASGKPSVQDISMSQTVDLPNVRALANIH